MNVSVIWLFLTVLWFGLQYVIVAFPVYIQIPFYRGMLYDKPIKLIEHLLKSNFGSDNCFAIYNAYAAWPLLNAQKS